MVAAHMTHRGALFQSLPSPEKATALPFCFKPPTQQSPQAHQPRLSFRT